MTVDWGQLEADMATAIRGSPVCIDALYEGATIRAQVVQDTDDDGELEVDTLTVHALASDLHANPIGRQMTLTPLGAAAAATYRILEQAETGDGWVELRLVIS